MTEGKIDFYKLKQELSNEVIDTDECYDFTWVGKKQLWYRQILLQQKL